MEIVFSPSAQEDITWWKRSNQPKILLRINQLLEAIENEPFKGIGKPEPLKHNLSGMWSRRINREHRIIYEVANGEIIIHALKEHY